MNLQNFLKIQKVKYFLNILLILTILFSFITTILMSTLLNGTVQPEMIVILVASSILLLFNLVLSRFIKNKVLLLVINLVLSVALIGSSIALFVNLQKFKVVEGFQTVIEAQADVDKAQAAVDKAQEDFNIKKAEVEKITDLVNQSQRIVDSYIRDSNLGYIVLATNKDYIYSDKELNNFKKLLTDAEGILTSADFLLANAQTELENANIALANAQQSGSSSVSPPIQPQLFVNTKLKAIEGVSYITAITSIFSGITIALTNLLMFSSKY